MRDLRQPISSVVRGVKDVPPDEKEWISEECFLAMPKKNKANTALGLSHQPPGIYNWNVLMTGAEADRLSLSLNCTGIVFLVVE
jgi:hypothetical protein